MNGLEVVVTGGTGALGKAVVASLTERGARCRVPVHDAPAAGETEGDARVEYAAGLDLTRESDVEKLFAVYDGDRPLWASVHLVGGFSWGPLADADGSVFERMMSLNARTCYLACRMAAVAMRATGSGGRIVNVAARPALTPTAGANMVAYTASKAAVAAMTVAMAEELKEAGIWVNAVAPSVIDTPENRRAMPDADHDSWPSPRDLAETIAFLVSPENRTTRGGVIPVYGRA